MIKKINFVGFIWCCVSLCMIFSASAATLHSTTEGGDWNDPATWLENTVPTANDTVEINGLVEIITGDECQKLIINADGTLRNRVNGHRTLEVYGDVINNGIVTLVNYSFTLNIGGDIINNGTWTNAKINLTGSQTQHVSCAPDSEFVATTSNITFIDSDPASPIVFDTDITFRDIGIDLNAGDVTIASGKKLSLFDGYLREANISSDNCTLYLNQNAYVSDLQISNVTLQGDVQFSQDVELVGDITLEGTLRNKTNQNVTTEVDGDFTNNGEITVTNYSFNLNITGDIINNGIWDNTTTTLAGTDDQHITCENGNLFSCTNFLDSVDSSVVIADTDLKFSGTQINLGSSDFYLNNHKLWLTNSAYLKNTTLWNAYLKGIVLIKDNYVVFQDTVVVQDTLQNSGYHYSITVNGTIINNGLIRNEGTYGLDAIITGDIINNEIWAARNITLTGSDPQHIYCAHDAYFSANNFVTSGDTISIIADSDINFVDANIDLNDGEFILSQNNTLSVIDGYLSDGILSANGGNLYLHDTAYLDYMTISNVNLQGIVNVYRNMVFDGEISVDDTLQNVSNNHSYLQVNGNLTNNGTIKDGDDYYSLDINITGDITNNGIWSNRDINFQGENPHNVWLETGKTFEISNLTNVTAGGDILAQTSLRFEQTYIYLNGTILQLPSNSDMSVVGERLFDGTLIGNNSDLYLHDTAYLDYMTISNVNLQGIVNVYRNMVFDGEISVDDTLQNVHNSHSYLQINGNLTNNGTIRNGDAYYSLDINITGDITNNGVWSNRDINFHGENIHNVWLDLDKTFEVANFTNVASGGDILAQTSLRFDDTYIYLNGTTLQLSSNSDISVVGGYLIAGNMIGNNNSLHMHDNAYLDDMTISDVNLQGIINLDDNIVFDGEISVDDTLQNIHNGHSYLQINGNLTNNGTIRNGDDYYILDIDITGDITNNGIWSNRNINFEGDSDHNIWLGTGSKFEIDNFTNVASGGDILAQTFLSFEGTVIDLNATTLSLKTGTSLSLIGGKLYETNLIGNNSTLSMNGGAFLDYVTADNLTLQGTIIAYHNIAFEGDAVLQDTLQNYSNSTTTVQFENLQNDGLIRNWSDYYKLYLDISGDFQNNGICSNHHININGETDQIVSLIGGTPIDTQIKFHAMVSGASSFEWGLDGEAIPGETSSTLIFDSVTEADYGTYVCQTNLGDSRQITVMSQRIYPGMALQLDGVNDYARILDSEDINLGIHAKRSVDVWFKVMDKNISSRKQVIYEEGGYARGLNIYVFDGSLYLGGWNNNESGWSGTYFSTDDIESGAWHHAALVLDGTSSLEPDAFKGYLDGVLIGSGEGSQLWEHFNNIGIGAVNEDTQFHSGDYYATGHYLEGIIEELHIWNRALTQEEVQSDMYNQLIGDEADLVCYLGFDQFEDLGIGNSGVNDCRDYSGYENHADILNGAILVESDLTAGPAIFFSDYAMNFGITPVNSTAMETLLIYNNGVAELVGSISTNAPFNLSLNNFSLLPGESQFVEVSFSPTNFGAITDSIQILSNDPNDSPTYIMVTGFAENADEIIQNHALTFDGYQDYVRIPRPENMPTETLTVSMWIKPNGQPEDVGLFALSSVGAYNGFIFFIDSDGIFEPQIRNHRFGNAVIPPDRWTHLAISYDGEMGKAYVNGLPAGELQYSTTFSWNSNIYLALEQDSPDGGFSNSQYFNGIIDDVRMWNYGLTQAEIQANMFGRITEIDESLVGYWRLDELENLDSGNPGVNDVRNYAPDHGHGDLIGDTQLVEIDVEVLPELVVDKNISNFGMNSVGTTLLDTILISNNGIGTLNANLAVDSPYSLNLTSISLSPQDSAEIIITVSPSNMGTFPDTLIITSNDTLQNPFYVHVNAAAGEPDAKYALQFDGENDYVQTDLIIDQTSSTTGITMEAWVYPTSNSSGRHHVISSDNGGYDWSILREGDGWHVFNGRTIKATNFSVDLNTWQHIAASFIPGEGVRFYKNGEEIFISGINYDSNIKPIAIGSNPQYLDEKFQGTIEEVRVWEIPLEIDQIHSNMYRHLNGDEANLIGYWRFNKGYSRSASDMTIYDNDGSFVGEPTWISSSAPILPIDEPDISISPQTIDFGLVPLNTIAYDSITISNIGELELSGNMTADEPFAITDTSFNLLSGATQTVGISFNPTLSDTFVDSIVITNNDPDETPYYYIVSGVGAIPLIETNPDSQLIFGGVPFDGTKTMTLQLFNIGTDFLDVSDIILEDQSDKYALAIDDTSFVIDPGDTFDLPITFTPDTNSGITNLFEATVQILSNAANDSLVEITLQAGITPKITLDEENFPHWIINDGGVDTVGTANLAIVSIDGLSMNGSYYYQARIYREDTGYSAYTYNESSDLWISSSESDTTLFPSISLLGRISFDDFSVYYKSLYDSIPDEKVGDDWKFSVNIRQRGAPFWSPDLDSLITVGSPTTPDTAFDMGWIEGYLVDSTDTGGRAPLARGIAGVRASPLNSLYETEINNIYEGYPDSSGYFKLAIPAGHQMQEINFRASDNNPLASVNISEDSTFNIPPNEISDVGTFIFGGKLMIDDGNFVIGESYTVPIYLTTAMLPFDEMNIELTYEEDWLNITEENIMIAPQYTNDLTIESQISSGHINITVYNDPDIVLDGDIIQLVFATDNNAPAGYNTVIHFQETSAIRGNNQIMLGNKDGTFCLVNTDSTPDIIVESEDIDVALYPGENAVEIITMKGTSPELSGVTINTVNAPDTTIFNYSPSSDTLSACEGSMVNLEFYAHPDFVGSYSFDMLFVVKDVAQDTIVKTDTIHVNFEILQPDLIVQPNLIQVVVDSGETAQQTLTIQGKGGIAEFILTKPDSVSWFEVSPDSGSVTGDETMPITLIFNETSHPDGFYESDLTVLVNVGQDYVPTDTVHVELTINEVVQFIEHPEIIHIQKLISKLNTVKNVDEEYDPAYDEDNNGEIDMEDLKAMIERWGD